MSATVGLAVAFAITFGCGSPDDERAPEDTVADDDATPMSEAPVPVRATPAPEVASSGAADVDEFTPDEIGQSIEAPVGDDATGQVFDPCLFYPCGLGFCQ